MSYSLRIKGQHVRTLTVAQGIAVIKILSEQRGSFPLVIDGENLGFFAKSDIEIVNDNLVQSPDSWKNNPEYAEEVSKKYWANEKKKEEWTDKKLETLPQEKVDYYRSMVIARFGVLIENSKDEHGNTLTRVKNYLKRYYRIIVRWQEGCSLDNYKTEHFINFFDKLEKPELLMQKPL